MSNRILLCGLNGSGKSTLGRALAEAAGYVFLDIEDYYFPKDDAGYAYRTARTKEEVCGLLLRDMQRHENLILASVRGDFGDEVTSLLRGAIHLTVPREVRLLRVRERSHRKFGDRMLPGGDLHAQEEAFFAMVAARTEHHVADWLAQAGLPVIEADGTLPVEENVRRLIGKIPFSLRARG